MTGSSSDHVILVLLSGTWEAPIRESGLSLLCHTGLRAGIQTQYNMSFRPQSRNPNTVQHVIPASEPESRGEEWGVDSELSSE